MQLIEAVPNVSEGKDLEIIRQIADDAVCNNSAKVLHIDSNADANRTVFTIAGEPTEVVKACVELISSATRYIDMHLHRGMHPRIGATDVCPLVPLREISLFETAVYAKELAWNIAEELHLPIYLYEANSSDPNRKNIAFLRRGEYENLEEKLKTLPPDFGPKSMTPFIEKVGATIIGARDVLIAFNMSLNSRDMEIAKQIAARLREKDGGLPGIKTMAWYMSGYGCTQISCNVVDYHKTNLVTLFETCKKEAAKFDLSVTAGEIIGLVPQEVMVQAGKHYTPYESNTDALIASAADRLLLNRIRRFDAQEKVLEYALKRNQLI